MLQLSIEQMQQDIRNNENLAFSGKQVFKKSNSDYRIKPRGSNLNPQPRGKIIS